MERIIGIDFGTSTTYMNVKRYHGDQPDGDKFSYIPVMFNYGESSGYVASIVRENADGSFDFGEKAAEQLEGAKVYTEIKMLLESTDEEQRQTARRITGEFFKFLYKTYTQQATNLGGADDTEETIISYPVKWQKETGEFMLDAARRAGFKNVRGMDEATAAVSTVLCHDTGKDLRCADKPGYLMLIDMGAGTTDLVVCRYQANPNGAVAVELVTNWPHSADEPTFGGREIDKALEGYVEDYLTKSLLNQSLLPIARDFATKPGESKKWKERHVSVNLAEGKPVATCGYVSPLRSMLSADFPVFDRTGFETLIESGLRDYARLIRGCLEKTAAMDENFSALDLVILAGGHSAWYFAKEILTGAMDGWLDHSALAAVRENPHRVVSLPNPQTTVSLGLVYSKLPFDLEKQTDEENAAVVVEPPQITEMESEPLPTDEGEKPALEEQEQTVTAAAEVAFCPACGLKTKAGANFCGSCGAALKPSIKSKRVGKQPHQNHSDNIDTPYTPLDRTKCPNCGTPYKGKETKCSLCGRKVRTMPTLPFKMNMVSWYTGEKKLGIAQATGTMTIMEDRLEFRRRFGNSAALLTPYTAVYSAAKANKQPKDILWMRDIVGAKVGKYGTNLPSLILLMKNGDKHTFVAPIVSQVWKESMEDALDLIHIHIQKDNTDGKNPD